jgi:hypothetical protein
MKRELRLRQPVESTHELTRGVLQVGDGYGIRLVSTGTHTQGNGPPTQTAVVEVGEVYEVEIDDKGNETEVENRPLAAEAALGETVPTNYDGADVLAQFEDDDVPAGEELDSDSQA